MGKKKSPSTPKYATTTFNSDLWGSSTTDKKGTVYSPENWMSDSMGTIGGNLNSTLQSMVNNDFTTDPNFQAYQNQFNRQMTDTYNNSVLNNLANRGLMRSSGLQAANNAFANNLADQQLNLYDNYYNRLNNNLSNMLNTSNTLYNYMLGNTANSAALNKDVNNWNWQKYNADLAASANKSSSLMGGIQGAMNGAMMGAQTGNPWVAAGGALIGGTSGALSS